MLLNDGQLFSIFIILAMICAGGVGLFCREIRSFRLNCRPSIEFEEIYFTYFNYINLPKKLVEEAWVKTAKALKISPDKLRPSDRFDKELRTLCIIDGDNELYDLILESANNNSFEYSNIETISDFIIFIVTIKID
jgi:hypothetical protein